MFKIAAKYISALLQETPILYESRGSRRIRTVTSQRPTAGRRRRRGPAPVTRPLSDRDTSADGSLKDSVKGS
jgi:hypothetical protein